MSLTVDLMVNGVTVDARERAASSANVRADTGLCEAAWGWMTIYLGDPRLAAVPDPHERSSAMLRDLALAPD
ncbi:MAG: hypothetical protein ACLTKG_08055 [Collinsella intestinalis]